MTIGVALSVSETPELGKKYSDFVKSHAGCEDLDCLREKSPAELSKLALGAISQVGDPVQPIMQGLGPVIDGFVLNDQLQNLIRKGQLKKHTPISWNYGHNEGWSFKAEAIARMSQVILISR